MQAFHNDPAIKERYLARVREHRAADQIIRGRYWSEGDDGVYRGCAVGCTIHGSEHGRYETELGIPRALAHLQDSLFEALPAEEALAFPEQFLDAIPVGASLDLIVAGVMVWVLSDPTYGAGQWLTDEADQPIKEAILGLYQRVLAGDAPSESEWRDAARAAAAWAAAAWAAAARAAEAWAADAWAAAAWAAAAWAAEAWAKFYVALRDHLLNLLRAAPVPEAVAI